MAAGNKQKLLVVLGPTATGKTALAIRLARRWGGEIISADSMQIYRGLDVGTAKATPQEQALAPHHLIDIRDPEELFSVAEFTALARQAVAEIAARGNLPILTGGTGLYISSLLEGLAFSDEPPDNGTRARLAREAAELGAAAMHTRLAGVDPETAAAIHPNNVKRVLRALELYEKTGRTMSGQRAASRPPEPPYDALVLGCYYLAASYYCKDEITDKDLAVFAAAFLLMNAVKPYINLLWLVLPLILPKKAWKARFKKWQVAAVLLVVAVAAVTKLVDWYGTALRYNYPAVERYLGDTVNQMEQLEFVLANLPRTFMVFVGSLYERGLFLGELGTFGAMDLSIPVVQLLSVLMLCLGAALAVHEKSSLTPKSAAGLLGLAVFYVFGVLAAQYITYTPVGLPHVAGVQARYLLPAFLMLFVLAAALLSHVLAPARAGGRRAEGLALSACGAAAAVCAVLLFQHYFVGPVCMVP